MRPALLRLVVSLSVIFGALAARPLEAEDARVEPEERFEAEASTPPTVASGALAARPPEAEIPARHKRGAVEATLSDFNSWASEKPAGHSSGAVDFDSGSLAEQAEAADDVQRRLKEEDVLRQIEADLRRKRTDGSAAQLAEAVLASLAAQNGEHSSRSADAATDGHSELEPEPVPQRRATAADALSPMAFLALSKQMRGRAEDGCENTDDQGQVDSWGDACKEYEKVDLHWACGEFDDSDFKAANLCCICGGGRKPDQASDFVQLVSSERPVQAIGETKRVAASRTKPKRAAAARTKPKRAAASWTKRKWAAASRTKPKRAAAARTKPKRAAAGRTTPKRAAASRTKRVAGPARDPAAVRHTSVGENGRAEHGRVSKIAGSADGGRHRLEGGGVSKDEWTDETDEDAHETRGRSRHQDGHGGAVSFLQLDAVEVEADDESSAFQGVTKGHDRTRSAKLQVNNHVRPMKAQRKQPRRSSQSGMSAHHPYAKKLKALQARYDSYSHGTGTQKLKEDVAKFQQRDLKKFRRDYKKAISE